jgi:glycosyltransferase involved in cell wall biosynthesis
VRVLFLAPYVPFPVRSGGHNRTLGLLRALASFATLDVLAIGSPDDAELPEARRALGPLAASLEVHPATGPGAAEADAGDLARLPDAACHFRSPGLAEAIALGRSPRPDLVHLEELVMAQYLDVLPAPAVVDRQKLEWRYHEEMAGRGGAEAEWHRAEAARFRAWERRLRGRFAAVLAVGEADRELLARSEDAGRVHVAPIAVDDALRFPADRTSAVEHVLLYGSFDYAPNREANARFFAEVWPRLRQAAPDLRVAVVGSGTPPPELPREDPRVELRGYVADVAPVLAGPGVLAVPLRVGGGARTKVLEALAAGMPVVSTAVGVEGLGLTPGRHYLRAEDAEACVAAILRLAREPGLVASLGRAGAELVDARFRWAAIGAALRPVYERAAATRPRVSRGGEPARRVLLAGVAPLPGDDAARALSFPGHRTEQLARAARDAGAAIHAVLLDEEGGARRPAPGCAGVELLGREAFRSGEALQRAHDAVRPDVVVAAGGYHAARVVAALRTETPRFLDLPGDLAAEAQLRGERDGDAAVRDALAVLSLALSAGDAFGVVGPSQRMALLGQLGLAGRLTGASVAEDPVLVVPVACDGPPAPAPWPDGGLQVLWWGSYNTWMDGATLLAGLERAAARSAELRFVATGGSVPGHDEATYPEFWARARSSPAALRLTDLGRVSRTAALKALRESHVVVCISRACVEAELGSRLRVVEALAHGRAVVMTDLGDLARDVRQAEAGLVVPPGDALALASALLRLAEDRGMLEACGRRARRLWEERFRPEVASRHFREWLAEPRPWPRSVLAAPAAEQERVRLQSELDAVRASRTFRALRLLDRLTGRARH